MRENGLQQAMLRYLPKALRHPAFIVWSLATRAMTMGVRCAFFDTQGRVFLVRHTYVKGWHMPGGGVERGETVMDALKKEVREEAGIVLTEPPGLFAIYRNTIHSRFDHVALYVARSLPAGPAPEPNVEIAETGWFALDALPEGTTQPTRTCLWEISQNLPPREVW
ncbi:MAG: NUDIX domain-containing protein [Pseudomonadota bacterium]